MASSPIDRTAMTYQPPVTPGYPPQPPRGDWAPPPPKAKSKAVPILVGVLVLLVVAVGGLLAVLANSGGKPAASASQAAPLPKDPCGGGICKTAPTTVPAAASYTPEPSDIKLTPKITRKKCFGSAGCNVDFRLDLDYSGPSLDADTTWLVSYEIDGVEDGPEIGSLELTGTKFTSQEESVQTANSKTKITLKVTSVDES